MLPHWCKTHSRKAVPHVHVMHQFLLHTERPARGQEPSAGEWCINDRLCVKRCSGIHRGLMVLGCP